MTSPNLDQERVERAAAEIGKLIDGRSMLVTPMTMLYARAAITAYLGDTHVVVPREPTPEMVEAALGPIRRGGRAGLLTADVVKQEEMLCRWRAMLSATPTSNGKEG